MAETEYRRLSCGGCGVDFLRVKQVGRVPWGCPGCIASQKRPKAPLTGCGIQKPCAYCQAPMTARNKSILEKQQFCSRECRGNSQRAKPSVTCEECGIGFHRRKGGKETREGREPKFCSYECCGKSQSRMRLAQFADQREAREKDKAVRALLRVIARLARIRKMQAPKPPCTCVLCGQQFERVNKYSRGKMCSPCAVAAKKQRRRADSSARKKTPEGRAAKLKHKALRRAKQRCVEADAIDPIRVFERDKWKCQLCGVRTPKKLRGTYDSHAPEVDHVVTFKDKGSHTWANVQCACRACNIRKAGKSLGQVGFGFM